MTSVRKVKNIAIVAMTLIFIFVCAVPVYANSNANPTDVSSKLVEISKKYEVGERLSDEDAEFVKRHANFSNDNSNVNARGIGLISSEGSFNFNEEITDPATGLTTILRGTAVAKINGLIPGDNYYGLSTGTLYTYGANRDNVISQELVVSASCYGVYGDGGLFKAYSGSITTEEQPTTTVIVNNWIEDITVFGAVYLTFDSIYGEVVASTGTLPRYIYRVNVSD